MKKLNASARVTEVDDTSDQLITIYNNATALADEPFLKATFAEMKTLSVKITEAIKSDKAQSDLDKADANRDAQIHALSKIITGYASIPIENLAKSGAALKKIFDKYGLKITRESYANESSLIESMLMDLGAESVKSDVEALQGVAETIAALRGAQDAFNKARLEYDTAKANDKACANATEVKKSLLAVINDKLVTYLNAMIVADNAKYGQFAGMVEAEINRVNEAVSARSSRKKAE